MQRNDCRAHVVERRRRLRVTGHRSLHLVSERAPRTVRGKFSQARELHLKARREIANASAGTRRKGLPLELAYGVCSSPTFHRDESIAPVLADTGDLQGEFLLAR